MPKLPSNRNPSYRLHKQSGQAVVTLCGRDILLGKFNSPESLAKYNAEVARWIANGHRPVEVPADATVGELLVRYRQHVEVYYRKGGVATSEVDNIRQAMRPLRHLFGGLQAAKSPPAGDGHECDLPPIQAKTAFCPSQQQSPAGCMVS
jgi:hypothetical protein